MWFLVIFVLLGVIISLVLSTGTVPNTYKNGPAWRTYVRFASIQKLMLLLHERLGVNGAKLLRRFSCIMPWHKEPGVKIESEVWDGVPVYIFRSEGSASTNSSTGIVYFHGGGFTVNGVVTYSIFLCKMVKETEAIVVAPDYRKAPEHPFPAAFDDCLAVTTRFIKQASDYGVDVNRIALIGDSAGGNLAAAVSHELCNNTSSSGKPKLQYLVYPGLQFTLYNLPSQMDNANDPILSRKVMNYYRFCYLGCVNKKRICKALLDHGHLIKDGKINTELMKYVDPSCLPERSASANEIPLSTSIKASERLSEDERDHIQGLIMNPHLSPLFASDEEIKNLPKTFVLTCTLDVLRDEGVLYYHRLRKLGVDVTHIQYEFPHTCFMASIYGCKLVRDASLDKAVSDHFQLLKEYL